MQGVQGYQPTVQLQPGVSGIGGLGGLQQNIINPEQIRAANTEWFNTTGTGQIYLFM